MNNCISKIDSHVSFPIKDFDMNSYLHYDARAQNTVYDLVAVICHDGSTRGGHYTTYALNHLTNEWYDFNDDFVTAVSHGYVTSCDAYILFYRKQSTSLERDRLAVKQLLMEAGLSEERSLSNSSCSVLSPIV